jgi:hypothetical protein
VPYGKPALVAAAAALLVAGCGGGAVTMPDVVGLTGRDALARICDAGLRPAAREPGVVVAGAHAAGWTAYEPIHPLSLRIVWTSPAAGERIARQHPVVLRVRDSRGGEPVVVGETCP